MKTTFRKHMISDNVETFICYDKIKGDIGDEYDVEIRRVNDKRSYAQLKLYRQALKYTAHNSPMNEFNTEKKVAHYCKCTLRWIEGYTYINNPKTKQKIIQLVPRSLSYEDMSHSEACEYINDAIELMAGIVKMENIIFIDAVKNSVGNL